jgi:hypothetical protein
MIVRVRNTEMKEAEDSKKGEEEIERER